MIHQRTHNYLCFCVFVVEYCTKYVDPLLFLYFYVVVFGCICFCMESLINLLDS